MPNKFIPPQTDSVTRSAATPLDGEVFYDTDEKKIYYGDGTTVGGVVVGAGGGGGLTVVYTTDVTLNASANNSYLLSGTTTVNLPVGVNGDRIGFADFDGGFFAAPVTITPNGAETVAGQSSLVLDRNYACVEVAFWSGNWVITSLESFNNAVGAGHTIEDEGTPLNQRAKLNFVGGGVTVTDDSGNDKTIVTIPANPVTRELLTANRTYYVRTDGNDSNDGLSDTAGGAFLTGQKAINVVAGLDIGIHDVTIQFGAGTYAGFSINPPIGTGSLTLVGDTATPSNVVLGQTGCTKASPVTVILKGFRFVSTGYGLNFSNSAILRIESCDFNSATASHLRGDDDGMIIFSTGIRISGGSGRFLDLNRGHAVISNKTVTLINTPNFTNEFIYCGNTGTATVYFATWVGSATGKRYTVAANGVVNTFGGSSLPGSNAGSVVTGGQYS